MKYLKIFEDFEDFDDNEDEFFDNIESDVDMEELKNSLSKLSDTFSRARKDLHNYKRKMTPTEIYEDYFLDFKESDGFRIRINRPGETSDFSMIVPIKISLEKIMPKKDINEALFNKLLTKLKTAKNRFESQNYTCHFTIVFGGTHQCDWNPKTYKNDDYKYKGVGDLDKGYDSEGKFYSSYDTHMPEGFAPIECQFWIV